jgi:urea carboxylase-associated protein 2
VGTSTEASAPEVAGTATTSGARDHARAQGMTRVRAMPTVPATAATDLPPDVEPRDVLWDEIVDPGEYAAHHLPRGTRLRLTDLDGEACAHVLVHNARRPAERLNLADTVKVQWQAYPTSGARLLSDMGRSLMSVTDDTSGRHDALCGAPNRAVHDEKYGDGSVSGPFPNARDQLTVAVLKAGMDRRDVGPSIAFFKGARVRRDGALELDTTQPRPGAFVTLCCDLDVHVAVANVPHVLDLRPDYVCSALRITAWRADGAADAGEAPTPEMERAAMNNVDWLGGVG